MIRARISQNWPPSSSAGSQSRWIYRRSWETNSSTNCVASRWSNGGESFATSWLRSTRPTLRLRRLTERLSDETLRFLDTPVGQVPDRWVLGRVFRHQRRRSVLAGFQEQQVSS